MSKVPLKVIEPNEKRLEWNPFPMDFIPERWVDTINVVLERNLLEVKDIDFFIFSQLSDAYNLQTLELLGVPEDKYYFWGREYGYTGNTCPVLCIDKMWDKYNKKGKKMKLEFNFDKKIGKMKEMHGVGQPPFWGPGDDLINYLGEAGIPYSRLHDVGGNYGGDV